MNSGPTSETVRQNVTRLRKAAGMSYAELSRELDRRGHAIPPLGLRRIESGERRVDVDDLMALALALDVNPHAVLLPPIRGTRVKRAITGYDLAPAVSTSALWYWAEGAYSISKVGESGPPEGAEPGYTPPAVRAFRRRVRPRVVMTDDERVKRRRLWIDLEIAKLQSRLQQEAKENDGVQTVELESAVIELHALDPADDDFWAGQPFDPAPPELSDVPDA
jgi:transcriptional regulator with XRE-family HTH domain